MNKRREFLAGEKELLVYIIMNGGAVDMGSLSEGMRNTIVCWKDTFMFQEPVPTVELNYALDTIRVTKWGREALAKGEASLTYTTD